MYMVFEDRLVVSKANQQYVGVSYLISEAYAHSEVRVIFTGSNTGMKTKLKELSSCIQDDEVVLAFIDLVADNQNTWGIYSRLVDIANRTEHGVICIVPIPCIEYCYLEAFNKMLSEQKDYQQMLRREHYTNTEVYMRGFLKRDNVSFEKLCKCIQRTFLPFDANRTSFQIKDKSFYNSFMGITGEPEDLIQKEWAAVQMLPAFFTGDGKIAIKESQISFIEMMDKMYGEFEEQINHYNAIGFNVGNASGIKKKYEQHREYLVKRLSSQGNVCCTKDPEMAKQTEGTKASDMSLF